MPSFGPFTIETALVADGSSRIAWGRVELRAFTSPDLRAHMVDVAQAVVGMSPTEAIVILKANLETLKDEER